MKLLALDLGKALVQRVCTAGADVVFLPVVQRGEERDVKRMLLVLRLLADLHASYATVPGSDYGGQAVVGVVRLQVVLVARLSV